MAGTNYILVFLVIVLVLFLVVFAIMFIGMRRSKQPDHTNEPVVGKDNMKSTSDVERLKYRGNEGAMDEDVGGNLRKVPQEAREKSEEGRLQ